jgi:hypothetical protein
VKPESGKRFLGRVLIKPLGGGLTLEEAGVWFTNGKHPGVKLLKAPR